MRSLVLTLLVLSAFAGCAAPDGTSDSPNGAASVPEPVTSTFTFGQPLGYDPSPLPPPVASEDPFHESLPFIVPANATLLVLTVDWACTSLCKLEVRLHDPSGAVAARKTGTDARFELESPAAGEWQFRWMSAEGASIGVEGQVEATASFG